MFRHRARRYLWNAASDLNPAANVEFRAPPRAGVLCTFQVPKRDNGKFKLGLCIFLVVQAEIRG